MIEWCLTYCVLILNTLRFQGYGVVYPQVNRQDPNRGASCSGFTFLVSLESFVGILFASFCGAIIFGKIARIQSIAQIRFSEPMVIRYGTGVLEGKPEDPDNDEDESDDGDGNKDTENRKEQGSGLTDTSMPAKTAGSNKSTKTVKFPPPVLEFRVINKLSMQKGGEIMNANINVVASTLEAKAIESLQFAEEKDKHDPLSPRNILRMGKEITHKTGKAILKTKDVTAKAAHKTVKVASSATHATSKALLRGSTGVKNTSGSLVQKLNRSIARTPLLETTPMSSFSENNEREAEPYNKEKQLVRDLRKQFALASLMAAAQSTRHLVCDEGNTGGLVPRRIFCKLEVDTDTHPFFKRVWIIRHVLNEESPLLTAKAKKIIHANHGKWPQDICNPEFIRDNLHFHQIIVSLTGTQNSSGSSVFGLNVYEFNSVNVGYTFVKMLDVNSEGKLFVDEELLNDVREQKGGGAEEIRGHRVDGFGTGRYGVTDGSGRQ